MTEKDLELKDMEQFHGTHQYWHLGPLYPSVYITDGIKYIMDSGYSWLVTDSMAVITLWPKVKREEFVVVDLKLLDNSEADMVITDGNEKELYRQHYTYTDARKEVRFYYMKADSVACLPSEL